MMMTTHSHQPDSTSVSQPVEATEKLTPYAYADSPCLASLDDETLAMAGRVEDFVDSFMTSPLANMLLTLDPTVANDVNSANTLSDQWLAMVMGPPLPAHLPNYRNLI
jgi:hypothetical protein